MRIEQGFDFVDHNVRKYGNKLNTKPKKDSIRSLKDKAKSIIKQGRGWNAESLIKKLTPVIQGWTNYHRNIEAYQPLTFFQMVINSLMKHCINARDGVTPAKTPKWIRQRFFGLSAKGCFSCMIINKQGKPKLLELLSPCDVPIVRYIKIKGCGNPFDSDYADCSNICCKAKNYHQLKLTI